MKHLIQGVREFHARLALGGDVRYEPLADSQDPGTLFICCSDSRVVPAFIATAGPGELFTVRNVGNLVPRVDVEGSSVGDRSEASAIEYALQVLHVADIVICGHSGCGAMTALLANAPLPTNLEHWLAHARGALDDGGFPASLGKGRDRADVLSQRNVLIQGRALESYPGVRAGMASRTLRVHRWWFDIRAPRIEVFDLARGCFVDFDEAHPRAVTDPHE